MKTSISRKHVQLLLRMFDEAYEKKAWHGPNLRGSLRGLTYTEAAWRPGTKRHNIWEIAIHAAYWKYIVRRKILNEKKESFALKGSNWFSRPLIFTTQSWKTDLQLLEESHRSLRSTISSLNDKNLNRIPSGSRYTLLYMISGIISHDIYHAGQIQLIKRLMKSG